MSSNYPKGPVSKALKFSRPDLKVKPRAAALAYLDYVMFLHDVAGAAKAEMAASKSRTLEEEHLAAALAKVERLYRG